MSVGTSRVPQPMERRETLFMTDAMDASGRVWLLRSGDPAMVCRDCGTELAANSKFCHFCGIEVASWVRPWVRYFARYFDYMLLGSACGAALIASVPSGGESEYGYLVLSAGSLVIWIFIEATLLSIWGTTPGKWLLSTKVRTSSGERLSYREALWRSYMVFFRGMGLFIPIVSFVTLIIAYSALKADGVSSWDRDGGFTITHGKIRIRRILVAIYIFIGLPLIFALGLGR